MEVFKLQDMVKGWFIGDFEPSLMKTNQFEVAVKSYLAGDFEPYHFHKIATEFTVIVDGEVEMFDQVFSTGDIVRVDTGDITSFKAITNVKTVVVKYPGASNDKYLV